MYRIGLVALLGWLFSCAPGNTGAELLEVRPSQIAADTNASVELIGSGFFSRAAVDLDNGKVTVIDGDFEVRIGTQDILASQVQPESAERLTATLPPLSDGVYDLIVTSPDGSEAELLQTLRVGSAGFDAGVGDAGGGDAGGADASYGDAGFGDAGLTTLVDTIVVPTNGQVVTSSIVLQAGQNYLLRASGTFLIATDILADAEYADFIDVPTSLQDTVPGVDFGIAINDLVVDIVRSPRWGAYNPSHVYDIVFPGTGATIQVNYHDGNPTNNVGSLTLEIWQ